jgi:hypothetical protein
MLVHSSLPDTYNLAEYLWGRLENNLQHGGA